MFETRVIAEVHVDPARKATLVPASRLTRTYLGKRRGIIGVGGYGGLASIRI